MSSYIINNLNYLRSLLKNNSNDSNNNDEMIFILNIIYRQFKELLSIDKQILKYTFNNTENDRKFLKYKEENAIDQVCKWDYSNIDELFKDVQKLHDKIHGLRKVINNKNKFIEKLIDNDVLQRKLTLKEIENNNLKKTIDELNLTIDIMKFKNI